jgi:hypothetical protein
MGHGKVLKDTDHGYRKRVKAIHETAENPLSITVGVHSGEGSATYEDGATVLEVAIWNEFGTSRIPARSFLRAWFDENRDEAKELWEALLKQVALGKITREVAIERFGLHCVGQIQERIASNIPPPNADSTVKRKGSSVALIDTGQLRSSITFKAGD